MQVHSSLPQLNFDILLNILPYLASRREVSSFMQVCKEFFCPAISHLLDPRRGDIILDTAKQASSFIVFMFATSYSERRFNSLSHLQIWIHFKPGYGDSAYVCDWMRIGKSLAEIVRRSVNLEHLTIGNAILELDDPDIFEVFRNLKSHKRLRELTVDIDQESGRRLLHRMEVSSVVNLAIVVRPPIVEGPEVLLPFTSTIISLRLDLPHLEGLRDLRCPQLRQLTLTTEDTIVTSDLLIAFPDLQDFIIESDAHLPPVVDDLTAFECRDGNRNLLAEDDTTTMRLRYVDGSVTSLYMMGLLPGIRELYLSTEIDVNLRRAIQVVRDCSPKVLRITINGSQYTGQEVKELLQELNEILNASGATHLYFHIELTGRALVASMASNPIAFIIPF